MNFFDDLQFVAADILENYNRTLDRRCPDIYTVEFIRRGAMLHGINGGPKDKVTRPAIFWHHPENSYQYGPISKDGSWQHRWVSFRGERGRRLLENGFMPLSPKGFIYVSRPLEVEQIFHTLLEKSSRPGPRDQAAAVVLLEQILCICMEQAYGIEEPHRNRIDGLCAEILKNPCARFNFEQQAAKMGFSYSHFRRLFKQKTGLPPHDYLLQCRMQAAADALKNLNHSIKQVSVEMGYEDPAQFSKLFRQKIGLSPKQFRQTLPQGER